MQRSRATKGRGEAHRMGAVYCVECGGVVRYIPAGQTPGVGPGERCGDLERSRGDTKRLEVEMRRCLKRQRERLVQGELWPGAAGPVGEG